MRTQSLHGHNAHEIADNVDLEVNVEVDELSVFCCIFDIKDIQPKLRALGFANLDHLLLLKDELRDEKSEWKDLCALGNVLTVLVPNSLGRRLEVKRFLLSINEAIVINARLVTAEVIQLINERRYLPPARVNFWYWLFSTIFWFLIPSSQKRIYN